MICDNCGCHDNVVRTIHEDGVTHRVRRCTKCGQVVSTEERKVVSPPKPKKKVSKAPKKSSNEAEPKPAEAKPETSFSTGALAKALASSG